MSDDGTTQIPLSRERSHQERPTPTLIIYDGDEIGALHALNKVETVIGRTPDCDVVLTDSQVSRAHAAVRRVVEGRDEFEIVDLESTNGTHLNGEPVIRKAALESGDKITIGGGLLKFALLDQHDLSYQSRIVEMIHVDDLTGLLTKRSLYRALEKELLRAARYNRNVAVLMMDLDFFKSVNDTHGHLVGSHCLAEVGKLIRETTRTIDVNGRYGGEEFVSFLPETDAGAALVVAERIRSTLAERVLRRKDVDYRITISIGVSIFPDHGGTVEALVHAADRALYRAKDRGRDRVELFDFELVGVR